MCVRARFSRSGSRKAYPRSFHNRSSHRGPCLPFFSVRGTEEINWARLNCGVQFFLSRAGLHVEGKTQGRRRTS